MLRMLKNPRYAPEKPDYLPWALQYAFGAGIGAFLGFCLQMFFPFSAPFYWMGTIGGGALLGAGVASTWGNTLFADVMMKVLPENPHPQTPGTRLISHFSLAAGLSLVLICTVRQALEMEFHRSHWLK